MKMIIIALALGLVLVAGCAMQPQTSGQLSVHRDIVYDSAHQLALDVYAPEDAADAPLVVFFYGNRWQQGRRAKYAYVGKALAARGFVAMVADYRAYPPAGYKQFLADSAEAVAWARAHAGEYGADQHKLFVMGYSAGAYNAVMLALDPEWMKAAGGNRNQLAGVIAISGPYDFLPITAPDMRTMFWPPSGFDKTQPGYWTDGHNPPILLIASHANKVANPADTQKLYDRIRQAGGPVSVVLYQGLSNRDTVQVLAQGQQRRADEMKNIAGFIHRTPAAQPQAESSSGISTQPTGINSISTLPAPTNLTPVAPVAPAASVQPPPVPLAPGSQGAAPSRGAY